VKTTRVDFATAGETAATGYPLRTIVQFAADVEMRDAVIEVMYTTHGGAVILCEQTTAYGGRELVLGNGMGAVEFTTNELGLQPGSYEVTCRIRQRGGEVLHTFERPERLVVDSGRSVRGYFYMPHLWRLLTGDAVSAPRGHETLDLESAVGVVRSSTR
jgi:hypothetical protein